MFYERARMVPGNTRRRKPLGVPGDLRRDGVVVDARFAVRDDCQGTRRASDGLPHGDADTPQPEVEGEDRGRGGHSGVSGVRGHGRDIDAESPRRQVPAPQLQTEAGGRRR